MYAHDYSRRTRGSPPDFDESQIIGGVLVRTRLILVRNPGKLLR
ncbi:hypothetical protein [Nonomuraea sp. NPDC002799]